MLLDIVPMRYENGDCFDNLIGTIASWKKLEYGLMFAEAWGFVFEPELPEFPGLIGPRVFAFKGDSLPILDKYHGIKITFHRNMPHDEALNAIKRELEENRPVLLETDIFYLPWQSGYSKIHNHHFIMVSGMEPANNCLICVDTIPLHHNVQLPIDCLAGKNIIFATLEFQKREAYPADYIDIIKNVIERVTGKIEYVDRFGEKYLPNNMFDSMRQLAEEINANMCLSGELRGYEGKDIYMAPLVWRAKNIGWARMQFACALRYIGALAKCKEPELLAKNMERAGTMWDMLSNSFVKYSVGYCPVDVNARVADKIRSIADYEEDIAYQLSVYTT